MFWSVFVGLCAKRGVSPNAVAKELALSSGSVTSWKGGAIPRPTTIKKIADYFAVSPDLFLAETDDPGIKKAPGINAEGLSAARKALLDAVDGLTDEQCEKLLGIVLEAKRVL
jgi:transcriptional regulator with XRE-family HTH domain|nr:MAG TPA: repressor protein [Caudoviricetes sp.]